MCVDLDLWFLLPSDPFLQMSIFFIDESANTKIPTEFRCHLGCNRQAGSNRLVRSLPKTKSHFSGWARSFGGKKSASQNEGR